MAVVLVIRVVLFEYCLEHNKDVCEKRFILNLPHTLEVDD